MGGDRIVVFEEQNYDWLVDKFLRDNTDIRSRWDTFVGEQYELSLQDPPEPDR